MPSGGPDDVVRYQESGDAWLRTGSETRIGGPRNRAHRLRNDQRSAGAGGTRGARVAGDVVTGLLEDVLDDAAQGEDDDDDERGDGRDQQAVLDGRSTVFVALVGELLEELEHWGSFP